MRNRWMLGILALAVTCSVLGGDAWARRWTPPDPAELGAKFVERLTKIGDHCAKRNARIAERCVPKIDELVFAGDFEGAELLADRCIAHINRSSDGCVAFLERLTGFYVRILEMLEADPATIQSVEDAGAAAAETIVASQEEAVAAIVAALPPSE